MPTFAEFLREQGRTYPPPRTWYPSLYAAWFRAERAAGRRPDKLPEREFRNQWERDEMIAVARRLYEQVGEPLSGRRHISHHGLPGKTAIVREFGSWANYMDEAGVPTAGRKRAKSWGGKQP